MTVTAPNRRPGKGDRAGRDEFEVMVDALMEEARERARRRRRRHGACAVLAAFLGVGLLAVINQSVRTVTGSAPDTRGPGFAAESSDARIAYVTAERYAKGWPYVNKLFVLNSDQGARLLLARNAGRPGLSWSPDGRKLAVAGWQGGLANIFVLNADGSGRRRLTYSDDYEADSVPAWSPDGKRIAFARSAWGQGYGPSSVYVMNADGSRRRRLALEAAPAAALAWSPDGRKLVVTTFTGTPTVGLYLVNADGSGQRKLTTAAAGPGSFPASAAWSPDGQKIAFANRSAIYVIDADGSGLHRLTVRGTQPAWSPDGRTIAFARHRSKYSDIYLMNADGTNNRRLTTRGAQPLWSPDGSKIAFRSSRDGNPEIYVMNADGTSRRRLTHDPLDDVELAWSPAQTHE